MITITARGVFSLLLVLTAAALIGPDGAAAQQQPAGSERDRQNCVCFDRATPMAGIQPFATQRARIGVALGETERVGRQTGVRVEDVTAGGPADRAGVRAGDILLSLDDQSLGDDPGTQLRRRLADTEPGDTVAVRLSRAGSELTIRVATEAATPFTFAFGGEPGVLRAALTQRGFGRDRLQLVDINDGLGRYFGTDEGVLVADAAADNRFGLQAGDVVLRVDGRAPRDAAHLRMMLASYRADEEVALEVMRDRRTTTLRGSASAR